MSFVTDAVFVSLLWVLHAAFSLYIYIGLYAGIVYNKLKLFVSSDHRINSADVKQRLTKMPEHIAFLVLEDHICCTDLANLVVWSIALDIRHISLYDVSGRLKQCQEKLLREIHDRRREVVGDVTHGVCWRPHVERDSESAVVVTRGGDGYPDVNGNGRLIMGNGKNGSNGNGGVSVENRSVNISIVSWKDGVHDITRAARSVCYKVLRDELFPGQITEDILESEMKTNKNMPEPSLLVRLGRTHSNIGFLPWQSRLTEMQSISSLHAVSFDDLFGVLKKFSRCEQRFGK